MAKKTSKKKAGGAAPRVAAKSITLPVLGKGEKYRGIALGADGKPTHHLVLLKGEFRGTHADALAWAKKQGGQLPDRQDGALLYANNADGAVKKEWHWLEPQYAGDEGCAWRQGFYGGGQGCDRKDGSGCAVAVRRVPIK